MPMKSKKVLKDLIKFGFAVLGLKRVSDGLVYGMPGTLVLPPCPPKPFLFLVLVLVPFLNRGIWLYQLPS